MRTVTIGVIQSSSNQVADGDVSVGTVSNFAFYEPAEFSVGTVSITATYEPSEISVSYLSAMAFLGAAALPTDDSEIGNLARFVFIDNADRGNVVIGNLTRLVFIDNADRGNVVIGNLTRLVFVRN